MAIMEGVKSAGVDTYTFHGYLVYSLITLTIAVRSIGEYTNRMTTEARFFFIRNAQAPRHAGMFGRAESLLPDITPEGREWAVLMGRQIRRLVNGDHSAITGVYSADSTRSRSTARVLMGGAGFPNPIETHDLLNHNKIPTPLVKERITRWTKDQKSGLYVVALSRRPLAALLGDKYGWNEEIIDTDPGTGEEGYIPTASLTEVVVTDHERIEVKSLGIRPDQLEGR